MIVGAVLRHLDIGLTWRLDEGDAWTVGSAPGSDVRLTGDGIARRHARLRFSDGGWRVHDLGGGTRLNGIGMTREEEIRRGDVIAFGSIRIAFDDDGRVPAPAPAAGRREIFPMPRSFEALMTLFGAAPRDVDGALVAARAGEALLRFCETPGRAETLLAAYKEGLRSDWPVVRAVAAHGVAAATMVLRKQPSGAADDLVALSHHPEDYVRDAAVRALANLDPLAAAPRLYDAAVDALENRCDPQTASTRAAELAATGDEALVDAFEARAISAALDGSDALARIAAASALAELAAAGSVPALRCLRSLPAASRDERERAFLVAALGRTGRPEARDALFAALGDPSAAVFQAACAALGAVRDPQLIGRLIAELAAVPDCDTERRARYRRALEDVTGERRGPDPAAWLAR